MTIAAPALTIPEAQWEATGDYLDDPFSRLTAEIELNGIPMHVEAFEIDADNRDGQHLRDADADDALGRLVGDGGFPVRTMTMHGREYAVLISPFGS